MPDVPQELSKQGVKPSTYERMQEWGWVDGMGRPATWAYWNSKRRVDTREDRYERS